VWCSLTRLCNQEGEIFDGATTSRKRLLSSGSEPPAKRPTFAALNEGSSDREGDVSAAVALAVTTAVDPVASTATTEELRRPAVSGFEPAVDEHFSASDFEDKEEIPSQHRRGKRARRAFGRDHNIVGGGPESDGEFSA
jgi:hypothetical protein